VVEAWRRALCRAGWVEGGDGEGPDGGGRVVVGRIATVSTCAGTDARAATVARRTGAVAEAMEGAAVAQVASRLGVTFAEVRVISNTTGDRANQRWDMRGALGGLSRVAGVLVDR
jgi:nucleoside phosphorylase